MSRLARILRRLLRIIGTTLKVTVVVTCLLTLITQEDLFAWAAVIFLPWILAVGLALGLSIDGISALRERRKQARSLEKTEPSPE